MQRELIDTLTNLTSDCILSFDLQLAANIFHVFGLS